jgi:hypothetical protein
MMINEGAIRASNCNPISFQTLPTICGLLTRNGGGCPPSFRFLEEWSSASGQLRSQQLSPFLSVSACLSTSCTRTSFDQLNPKKTHTNGECNLMMCVSPFSFSSSWCATTRWQALLFSFFLVDLFLFSFLSFLAVIYWSDDEEGERLSAWLSRGAGVKC